MPCAGLSGSRMVFPHPAYIAPLRMTPWYTALWTLSIPHEGTMSGYVLLSAVKIVSCIEALLRLAYCAHVLASDKYWSITLLSLSVPS